jgi:hypothetical protein
MRCRTEIAGEKGGGSSYCSCLKWRLFILAWSEVGDAESGGSLLVCLELAVVCSAQLLGSFGAPAIILSLIIRPRTSKDLNLYNIL